jgi:hypothetical protein
MQKLKMTAAVSVAALGALLAGAGSASADATAAGAASHSPGVLSGNLLQVPIHIPVNICGNTANLAEPGVRQLLRQHAGLLTPR